MGRFETEIIDAALTSFVDSTRDSNQALRPKLIYNNAEKRTIVLTAIDQNLRCCEIFWFSVAFITKSGLICIKDALIDAQDKGVQGRILTTDYLAFNEPDALRDLLQFHNLEVRIFTSEAFHTKGYMFRLNDHQAFMVGSSNLTQYALKQTKEWNMQITSLEQGEVIQSANAEFESMWEAAQVLDEAWISAYQQQYEKYAPIRAAYHPQTVVSQALVPNSMQVAASRSLDQLRRDGANRALVVSATGTGKTYLSAFDVRNVHPQRMLFLVHRENILRKAKESFEEVIDRDIKTGILSGNQKDRQADYLFATTSMMAREDVLNEYKPDYFDYIIIDETHRAGAAGYRRIIDHFKPRFMLGMSATPERSDGYDIYSMFDHNIAYEIRLKQALENNLLCPFHYFGIAELTINGKAVDEFTDFITLISEERVARIIEKLRLYGHSGNRARGLVFCSNVCEAKELSRQFNERGFYTVALSGEDSENVRAQAIAQLDQKERASGLDYIFTVDIFNEGIDIPSINQIVMLRPTQSAIIFIQQLGRGLRKYNEKEYVVVLDFIGNYKQNYLIPIALSDDRSYNKDSIRRFVAEGNMLIPGCSTITFDAITREKIYAAIDEARLNSAQLLREGYFELKHKLGRIPAIADFENFGTISIAKYIDKYQSYYDFLVKNEPEYAVRLNDQEVQLLRFVSTKFASGKRVHELELLSILMAQEGNCLVPFKKAMIENYGILVSDLEIESACRNLMNQFTKVSEQEKYAYCVFIEEWNNDYRISEQFAVYLQNVQFKAIFTELITYGVNQYETNYSNRYDGTNFTLYQQYTYEDVCRLLNWQRNQNAQNIGGYFFDKRTKTLPVFINYVKDEESIAYEDRFISPELLIALSKHPRKLDSIDVQNIYDTTQQGNKVYLFIRKVKNDHEAQEFYFLGEIKAVDKPKPVFLQASQDKAFEIMYRLETAVREDIYDYITAN